MPDNEYDRAIFADTNCHERSLVNLDLTGMFQGLLESLFADILHKVHIHEGTKCDVHIDDLRAALNNYTRPVRSWWPLVHGPVAECLDWHRTNTGLFIDSRIEGSGDALGFDVRSETLDRRLAAAFDPAPKATTYVETDYLNGRLEFTKVALPWLLLAGRPELTQVRQIAQEWQEEWAEVLRWRKK